MPTFDGTDDYFDSRDLIARLEELRAHKSHAEQVGEDMDEGSADELEDLEEFAEEASRNVSDWEDGELFVSDDYFETYAEELARDIGAIGNDTDGWPLYYIDWERAADALKMDYTDFTLNGTTYWARA